MSARAPRLVRNPNLVAYWKEGSFVVEDFERRCEITASSGVVMLLAAFDKPRTIRDATRDFPRYDPASVSKEARRLARLGFLVSASGKKRPRDLFAVWRESFPAIYFQSVTRDGNYATSAREKRDFFREVLSGSRQPALHKDYPGRPEVRLPEGPSDPGMPLRKVLRERRTVREFRRRSIPLADLSAVLRGTFGQTGWLDAGVLGRLIARTSPSAGARHPIECYLLAWRIEGLPAGLYHYSVRKDRLERLRRGDFRSEAARFASGQGWIRNAAFVCVLTAVADRVFWKYRGASAYRLFFLDAGHLAQTFLLLAAERGMGAFTTAAIQEKRIESFCGLDGIAEFPIYFCGAGVPAGPSSSSDLEPISSSRRR